MEIDRSGAAANAFNLEVEQSDDGSWCVVRTVDGRRHVISRHADQARAQAAAASINDTSRNDIVGERDKDVAVVQAAGNVDRPLDDASEMADRPAAGNVPNEDEAIEAFDRGDDRPLREQRELVDDTGTDIRQYTGEPVDTEAGPVIPQQTAVGSQRVVGGGEFPNSADHEIAGREGPDSDDEPDTRAQWPRRRAAGTGDSTSSPSVDE
jgi:hypothetical protein